MKSRLDRYNVDESSEKKIQQHSRLSRNKHLYDDLNNKIGFEELVDFNTQTRIELSSLNEPKKSRESYQQLKDYQGLLQNEEEKKEEIVEEEEEKVFDINSILEEARKNRSEIDELEKKRKLVISDDNDEGTICYSDRLNKINSSLFGYDNAKEKLPSFMQMHDLFPLNYSTNTHDLMMENRNFSTDGTPKSHYDNLFAIGAVEKGPFCARFPQSKCWRLEYLRRFR